MKKIFLRSITVSALSLAGNQVFAQEITNVEDTKDQKAALETSNSSGSNLVSQEQMDTIKKELEKKDPTKNTVIPYGVIQFNANTSDTQRSNVPDFSASKVRAGLKVSGGIVSADAQLQYNGNQQSTQTVTNAGADATSKPNPTIGTTSGDSGNNSVTIRKAQLNLDVLTLKSNENTYTTTVSLGGVRVGGAEAAAPDITWVPSGYSRQDGAYLNQSLAFGKTASVELGLGAFNNIFAMKNPTHPGTSGSGYAGWGNANEATIKTNWTSPSFAGSIGYLGSLNAAYHLDENQSLVAAGYYGTQLNSPSAQDSSGALTQARDVAHIEAAVTYKNTAVFGDKGVLSGNGISLFYENENTGTSYQASKNNGSFSYAHNLDAGQIVDDSQNTTLIGLSAAGDSSNYLTNMLQKGDRLTYAASYSKVYSVFGNSSYSKDYHAEQAAASIGYAVNTFETAFNVEFDHSSDNIFANENGNVVRNKAIKSYLTAAYAF